MPPIYRPHDLVHLVPRALPAGAPAWARDAVAAGQPAVVRRGSRDGRHLPVGIRGATRAQRYAACVEQFRLAGAPITPESLTVDAQRAVPRSHTPALAVCPTLADVMAGWTGAWGIGGAVGFELATGAAATHADSDIDVLLRLPRRPAHAVLAALAERLAGLAVRCDVQLETPAGGVALADWLGSAERVLVKSDQGPYLAADPWAPAAEARQ